MSMTETSFQRALAAAEAEKVRKWTEYERLPRKAFYDGPSRVTVKLHGRTMYLLRLAEKQGVDLARKGWTDGLHVAEFRRFNTKLKRCSTCRNWKKHRHFSPDERNADGRHSQCKRCRRIQARVNYARKKQVANSEV